MTALKLVEPQDQVEYMVRPMETDGRPVSSSRIRAELLRGEDAGTTG